MTCCPIAMQWRQVSTQLWLKICTQLCGQRSLHVHVTSCSHCRFLLNICLETSLKVNVVSLILKGVFAAPLPIPLDPIPTEFLAVYSCPSFALELYSFLSKVSILSSGLAAPTVVELIDCPASACCKSKSQSVNKREFQAAGIIQGIP